MARAIYGAGLEGMSGSINKAAGGWSFGKNGTVRRRTSPIQAFTSAQARVKAQETLAAGTWGSTLTPAQREAWNTAAKSGEWNFTDPLTGTTKTRSGLNLFIALNANIAMLNQDVDASLVDVPVKETAGTTFISGIVADASAGTVAVTYSGALGTNESHVLLFSPPLSPGRMAFNSSKLSFCETSAAVSPIAAGVAYVAKHGAITSLTDYNICYLVLAINDVTGQKRVAGQGVVQIVA